MRSIWHKVCIRLFTFLKIFAARTCTSCGATYRHKHELFGALQNTSVLLTDVENYVQIDP